MLRRAWTSRVWLLTGAILCSLVGCVESDQKLEDDDPNKPIDYRVETIGDITSVANANPLPLGGVGLVEGLAGTGGPAPKDGYRKMLEEHLRKRGVRNVKALLNSPNHSLVLLSATLPAGAHRGQRFNVEVTCPPRSVTTSLRGGRLVSCVLFYYNTTSNVSPTFDGPSSILKGHNVARAGGQIQLELTEGGHAGKATKGVIYEGGVSLIDQPLAITMKPNHRFANFADMVARRINHTFTGRQGIAPDAELATPRNNSVITLRVPKQYRSNMPRFIRTVRLIPLQDTYRLPGATNEGTKTYKQRLADDLHDPSRTILAALRLEALGNESVSSLKSGLKSDNPLVRFASAEALAYLGAADASRELGGCIETQPKLRGLALTAIASLDERIARAELAELVQTSNDPEVRYGAFRALRNLEPDNPVLTGELLNGSFWLHRIRTNGDKLVHLSGKQRPEVVLFGKGIALKSPFALRAGNFAVTCDSGDDHCIVSYFHEQSVHPVRRPCSLMLDEILDTMAKLDATYPDAVEIVRQAHDSKGINCKVLVDSLPLKTEPEELVEAGRAGEAGLKSVGIRKLAIADVERIRTERRLASQEPTREEIQRRAEQMLIDEPGKQPTKQRAEATLPAPLESGKGH